jgi:hypothetical protein
MKQLFFILTLLLSFSVTTQTAQASIPAFSSTSITVSTTIGEPNAKKTTAPKQNIFAKATKWLKKVAEDDKSALFYVLAILLGPLGLHRLVMGSKPTIVLWYVLITLGLGLAYILLTLLTFGLWAFIGWIFFWALPLFDVIKALTKGVGVFAGNNDIFAGFK